MVQCTGGVAMAAGACLLIGGGCSANRATDADMLHRTITVAVGGTTTLELPWTAGTGYSWTLDRMHATGMTGISVTALDASAPSDRVGGQGMERWAIGGVKAGTATLPFMYRRSWETAVAPARTAEVTVVID